MVDYRTESHLAGFKDSFLKGPSGDPSAETAQFADYLASALARLGGGHPFMQIMLNGKVPEEAARQALNNTKLANKIFRNSLAKGGLKALAASKDPLVALAYRLEPYMTNLRKQEVEAASAIFDAQIRIAKARFEVFGHDIYPDATFTLRLSYGAVETYPMEGTLAQPYTTFAGMYDRADSWRGEAGLAEARRGAWGLPERWDIARSAINTRTPLNFITNNDIAAGNSGSPLVDQKGELVGLVFDGNIHSLAGIHYYDPKMNRTVSVDSRAIIEALNTVMGAKHLADELLGR